MALGNPASTQPLVGIYNVDQIPSLTMQSGSSITGATLLTTTLTSPTINTPSINGGTINGGNQVDTIDNDTVRNTSSLNSINTTTLATVSGLAINVSVSGVYSVLAALSVSTNGTAGVQIALAASNTLALTSMNLTGKFFTANSVAAVNTTTLGGGIGSTATVILAELAGVFSVATAGTIVVQAAQNVATTGTTTILQNGFLQLVRMS
jgi:hypothetical protein